MIKAEWFEKVAVDIIGPIRKLLRGAKLFKGTEEADLLKRQLESHLHEKQRKSIERDYSRSVNR